MPRWLQRVFAKSRSVLRATAVETELDDELRFHLERDVAERVARGVSPRDARRAAMMALEGLEPAKERCRETQPFRWGKDFAQDVRYALRSLRRTPGFTSVALLTLALGIGANTAMFSVLNTFLLSPLPYRQPERLVRMYRTAPESQSWSMSAANLLDEREKNDVFEDLVTFNNVSQAFVEEGQAAERLQGMAVSASFFQTMGVLPAIGRGFAPEEDQPGGGAVVVLSDRFWRRRFAGDPNVVGRAMRLDGEQVKIIGVTSADFDAPLLWGTVEIWRPLALTAEQRQNRSNNYLNALARLKPGVSIEQAQASMAALFASVKENSRDQSLRLEPLQRSTAGDTERTTMWFAFGLTGVVLLIACVNLANLQLVRTTTRIHEHSIRAALGAARSRLVRQSLTESLVIALLGGLLSLGVALEGVAFIDRRLFGEVPGARLALDFRVFGFALLCSVAIGLVFGMVPAWWASRADVNRSLKQSPRGSTAHAHHRLRHVLIVGEVAFALMLLTGAGLFVRGLERFAQRDSGWRVDGLLTAQLGLRGADYATPAQRLIFYQQLEERLRALPGVQDVGFSNSQAAFGFNSSSGALIEGLPQPLPGQYPEAFFEQVSGGYFETMGIRLLEGRRFTSADTADRPQIAIINETMARRFWPNESAIGKRVTRAMADAAGRPLPVRNWFEVVGVVNDVRSPASLDDPYTRLQVFRPLTQVPVPGVSIMLRTSVPPDTLSDALRRAVNELDPTQPVQRIRTARSLVDTGIGGVTLLGTLLGTFAALGLVLSAVGIYGVTSFAVVQRTGEFGIRLAIGAQTQDVLRLALAGGARAILLGMLLGAAGAYGVSRLLASALPTLPTRDPVAFVGLAGVLAAVALVACYVPARRATKVDPLVALRQE